MSNTLQPVKVCPNCTAKFTDETCYCQDDYNSTTLCTCGFRHDEGVVCPEDGVFILDPAGLRAVPVLRQQAITNVGIANLLTHWQKTFANFPSELAPSAPHKKSQK